MKMNRLWEDKISDVQESVGVHAILWTCTENPVSNCRECDQKKESWFVPIKYTTTLRNICHNICRIYRSPYLPSQPRSSLGFFDGVGRLTELFTPPLVDLAPPVGLECSVCFMISKKRQSKMNNRTDKQLAVERTLHIPHNNVVQGLVFHGRWAGL